MNVSKFQKAIATVAYADIFNYPLTREEISYWAVGGLHEMPPGTKHLETKRRGGKEYFFLSGRSHIVALRQVRKKIAVRKWHRIYHIMNYFGFIPTLLLVGVTGGLAVDNAKENDDIDVFFITRRNTIWVTRSIVTLVAEWLGVRRRPDAKTVTDTICLNMFMAEDALGLPKAEQDLFAAHEVLQMVPLWEREGVYRTFLRANRWVNYFLPRAWEERLSVAGQTEPRKSKNIALSFVRVVISLFEPIARFTQLWYMNNRRTNEVIRSGMIRFHPRDARQWVREKYASRLKRQHIPLDKIFYRR